MDEIEGQQPDGPGLIESVWRYRNAVVATALVFALLGVGYASSVKKTYTASARVGLEDPPRIQNVVVDLGRYTNLASAFAVTSEVLDPAAKSLGMSEGALAASVSTSISTTANEIGLTAKGHTAQQAEERVAAVAASFQDGLGKDAQQRATEQLKAIDAAIATAKTYISSGNGPLVTAGTNALTQALQARSTITAEVGRFGNGVRFIDSSSAGSNQTGLKLDLQYAVIGGLVGLALAMAAAWVWADRHQVVDDVATAGTMLGAPLLGEIPMLRSADRVSLTVPAAMPAPPFQFAASALKSSVERGVLVVSGPRSAGSTVTALNVAAAAAREGQRVLVVDADNDGRTLSKLVGADNDQPGVADIAAGRLDADSLSPFVLDLDGQARFDVLPAGATEPDAASLYRSVDMVNAFAAYRNRYDLVIVDCPPFTTEPEASSLSIHADGLLLVVRSGSARSYVEELKQRVDVLSADVVGFIFNASGSRSARELTTGRRSSPLRSRQTAGRTKRRSAAR